MTKKEIVKTISEAIGMTQLKTKEIVQNTFDAIVETLVEEGLEEADHTSRVAAAEENPPSEE